VRWLALVNSFIYYNKQLTLDEKICCEDDGNCRNVETRCYNNNKLVKCHEISGVSACERKSGKVEEICKKENQDKHLCISANSTISPDLDDELD
jgi:hypothetical protein